MVPAVLNAASMYKTKLVPSSYTPSIWFRPALRTKLDFQRIRLRQTCKMPGLSVSEHVWLALSQNVIHSEGSKYLGNPGQSAKIDPDFSGFNADPALKS